MVLCAIVHGGKRQAKLATLVIWAVILLPMANAPAEDSVTERLIREEVMRLDGEWESDGKSIKLLAFTGGEFRSEHLEMLSHLETVEWFYCESVDVNRDDMRWLHSQTHMKQLDLLDSGEAVNGLALLGNRVLSKIERIRLSNCELDDAVLNEIKKMTSLETAEFLDVIVEAQSLSKLSACSKLKKLDIQATNHVDPIILRNLQSKLVNCEVSVIQVASPVSP